MTSNFSTFSTRFTLINIIYFNIINIIYFNIINIIYFSIINIIYFNKYKGFFSIEFKMPRNWLSAVFSRINPRKKEIVMEILALMTSNLFEFQLVMHRWRMKYSLISGLSELKLLKEEQMNIHSTARNENLEILKRFTMFLP